MSFKIIILYVFFFSSKFIEGGVDMGTSTGDVTHGSQLNTERPESGPGELIVTTENNANNGGETNATSALPSGNILFCWSLSMIDYFLDELVDEHEEEQINAEEDAGGEQWFDFIHPSVFNLVSLFAFLFYRQK